MRTVFSTSAVHAQHRFDYWHGTARERLVDHDSRPACRSTFHAELRAGALADVGLVLFENSAMTVSHTAAHASRLFADELFVCRQMAGALVIEQDGRDATLQPGDIALLDPRLPYIGRFSARSATFVLKVPRRSLEARTGRTRELTVRLLKPQATETGLASALLAALPEYVEGLAPSAEELVRDQVLDLFSISLLKATQQRRPRVSNPRSVVLLNLRAAIEARLTDPSLTPREVAAAAAVSVRYANDVLEEVNTSIQRLIQTRRLARCRQALEDPSQRHRTVSDIAYGWGFSDMTHFGRRFKAAFGLLPSDFRKACDEERAAQRSGRPSDA
jgi:AraC-like DNA-binding protein